jgi:hypothetical protein
MSTCNKKRITLDLFKNNHNIRNGGILNSGKVYQNELERGGLKYSICETKVVFMSFEIAGGRHTLLDCLDNVCILYNTYLPLYQLNLQEPTQQTCGC